LCYGKGFELRNIKAVSRITRLVLFAQILIHGILGQLPIASAASYEITIASTGGAAENFGWSISGETLTATSANVTINSSDIIAKLATGNLIIDSEKITINDSITSTSSSSLRFSASGNIIVGQKIGISTNGGNIIFQADSDANGTGSIRLGNSATSSLGTVNSNGGEIIFSGGTNIRSGYASTSSDTATSKPKAGVSIYGFQIDAGGGNITVRGKNADKNGSVRGVLIEGLNARASRSLLKTSGSGTVTITGDSDGSISSTNPWGVVMDAVDIQTELGEISISGKGDNDSANSRGVVLYSTQFTSGGGDIRVIDSTDGSSSNYYGSIIGFVSGSTQPSFSTSGTLEWESDEIIFDGTVSLTLSCSSASFKSYTTSSFSARPSIPQINASDCSNLAIGDIGNASNLTLSGSITVGGAINLIGTDISILGALTATDSNIAIEATGAVTQSSAITASGLSMSGPGNYLLTNVNNNVSTVAAGTSLSRVARLDYKNKLSLSIGTVNGISGAYSSGQIRLVTVDGNLTVTKPISTLATAGDSLTVIANEASVSGESGNGNIIFSDLGSVTIETGSRGLLYSGTRASSTGVISSVGGEANSRSLVDTATSLSSVSPSIASTGLFALFRTDAPSPTYNASASANPCSLPIISNVWPEGGSSEGGTRVTVHGQGLSNKRLYFGTLLASKLTSDNNSIFATSPPGVKGQVNLTVEGCGTTAVYPWNYDPEPVILSIDSSNLSTIGSKIRLIGKFFSGASLSIPGTEISILSNSDTEIVAMVSPSESGNKKLTLTTKYGTTVTNLTFISPPSLEMARLDQYIAQGDLVSLQINGINTTTYLTEGNLPPGLSLKERTGEITGVAQKEGRYSFTILAMNQIGSTKKTFSIEVDRPTPKPVNLNLYFSYNSSKLSYSSQINLDRILSRIKFYAPRNLFPSVEMYGGGGNQALNLSGLRQEEIKQYVISSGFKVKEFKSGSGMPNKIKLRFIWHR
jgi:hypothetical protein